MAVADKRMIKLRVNGLEYERSIEPRKLFVDFLREDLGLTGTHIGCEHGVCGACTVLYNGESVHSCLMFAVQADGAEVVTIEGLAQDSRLHPLQEAFWENHALQCGFCTPGMLIAAYELLSSGPGAGEEEIRSGLSGNLCRCTGYQTIIEAVRDAAQKLSEDK